MGICSPGQSSMAAVHAGFYQFYVYGEKLLGFTPCALTRLPHHGVQEQSIKKKHAQSIHNYFDHNLMCLALSKQEKAGVEVVSKKLCQT